MASDRGPDTDQALPLLHEGPEDPKMGICPHLPQQPVKSDSPKTDTETKVRKASLSLHQAVHES